MHKKKTVEQYQNYSGVVKLEQIWRAWYTWLMDVV